VERTLIIVKPDAVERGRVGDVISRFERAGFSICATATLVLSRARAEEFYAEHVGKPFYERLVSYMTSGPVVVLALEAEGAIARARLLAGTTNPAEAAPGSLRGDYGLDNTRNSVHASDSPASAQRELRFFFPDATP
jgi:nucleoside-diphosphate kinase